MQNRNDKPFLPYFWHKFLFLSVSKGPRNLTCEPSSTEIYLEWSSPYSPTEACDSEIEYYEIYYEGISYYQENVTEDDTEDVTEHFWVLVDPLPGANYTFIVNAVYDNDSISIEASAECASLEKG